MEGYQNYKQIQEIERNRIANELHDTSLQNLTHLTHKIELAGLYLDTDVNKTKLELAQINIELKNTIESIRETIFNLRPMSFDDLGFKETTERYLEKILTQNDLKLDYHIDDINEIGNEVLLDIYRIIQECTTNVVKHAKAQKLTIELKYESCKIMITVKDDGTGFSEEENVKKGNHFGLTIVQERVQLLNGTCGIESIPGEGTTVNIEIPISKTVGIKGDY